MSATFDRRTYAREYARMKRAAKVAAKNSGSSVCQKGRGRHAVCGGVLETITDGDGRTALVCPLCERKRRGICRDCGLPVAGRVGWALRCAFHTAEARRKFERAYKARNLALVRRRARDYYRQDEERREKRNARKTIWRQAHPEKVKQYKRREALSQNPNRAEYHRKRRARERLQLATRERQRYHGDVPLRTCLTPSCDIVVTGRKKKCTRCRERQRVEAAQQLAELQRLERAS